MQRTLLPILHSLVLIVLALVAGQQRPAVRPSAPVAPVALVAPPAAAVTVEANAARLVEEGRRAFRHDTFGDERFWGGTLRLHEALAGAANGGVGPGVSPATALAVGLKVDSEALTGDVRYLLETGQVDLDDPAVTLALLRLNAVVGVTGFFDEGGGLESFGIQCSLCHSTVDDGFAPGIGRRRDGWPNRDLDVGTIISLAPDLSFFTAHLGVDEDTVRSVLTSWGPGRFDAHLILDGKATRPDGGNASVLIPAVFGLAGTNLSTYNGWGAVSHWNALVANLEMGGVGTFYDPRLKDAATFPLAAAAGLDDVRNADDRVSGKLAALQVFQLALPVPEPPAGSIDAVAAERGRGLFEGAAGCATCHVPPLFTEPGWNLHTPEEIGIDDFQADRGPEGRYRTTPLGGTVARSKGGWFHDGRFATLVDVVRHYDRTFALDLDRDQVADLVEYLKSL